MSVFRSERRARRGGPFRGWCGSRWPKPGTVSRNRPQESAGTARIDAKTGCPAPETVGYFRSAEIGVNRWSNFWGPLYKAPEALADLDKAAAICTQLIEEEKQSHLAKDLALILLN